MIIDFSNQVHYQMKISNKAIRELVGNNIYYYCQEIGYDSSDEHDLCGKIAGVLLEAIPLDELIEHQPWDDLIEYTYQELRETAGCRVYNRCRNLGYSESDNNDECGKIAGRLLNAISIIELMECRYLDLDGLIWNACAELNLQVKRPAIKGNKTTIMGGQK